VLPRHLVAVAGAVLGYGRSTHLAGLGAATRANSALSRGQPSPRTTILRTNRARSPLSAPQRRTGHLTNVRQFWKTSLGGQPTCMPGRCLGFGSTLRMISRATGAVSPCPSTR
jgi:hypothetical protein